MERVAEKNTKPLDESFLRSQLKQKTDNQEKWRAAAQEWTFWMMRLTQVYEKRGKEKLLLGMYGFIWAGYTITGDYDQALVWRSAMCKQCEMEEKSRDLSLNYLELGRIQAMRGECGQVYLWLQKAVEAADDGSVHRQEAYDLMRRIAYFEKDFTKALQYKHLEMYWRKLEHKPYEEKESQQALLEKIFDDWILKRIYQEAGNQEQEEIYQQQVSELYRKAEHDGANIGMILAGMGISQLEQGI